MSLPPLHYLNASAADGRFHNEGKNPSNPAQVDALMQHLAANNVPKLVIHFHGGLVPEKNGVKVAQKMLENYQGSSHALSVIWDTGLLTTLVDQYELVEKTTLFKQIRDIVLKKAYEKLGIEEGAKGPVPLEDEKIQSELQNDLPFADYDDAAREKAQQWDGATIMAKQAVIEAELEAEIDLDHAVVAAVKAEGPSDQFYKEEHQMPETATEEGARGVLSLAIIKPLASVVIRVIKRFWRNTDHDLYPTVVEEVLREFYVAELGANVWQAMKDKAAALWVDNTGLQGDDQHAGRYLLNALSQHKAAHPGFVVDLVGHSAGSIAICHMLRCMAENYQNLLPVRKVIFLAPACRTELFVAEMLTEPKRFDHFRMFTMDDAHEKKDNCVPYFYTHSLLYLISGILEQGEHHAYILGLAKQLSDAKPYKEVEALKKVREFLSTDNHLVLSPSPDGAASGFESRSLAHGDFDGDESTLRSLVSLIVE